MYSANYQERFWKEIGKELERLHIKPERSEPKRVIEEKPKTQGPYSPLSPEILSMTTHDMLTPLSAISGNLKLLKKCLESDQNIEKIGKYSSGINSGVHDMIEILTQFRDIALAESGRAELDLTETEIIGVLIDMKSLFDSLITKKKQKIVLETEGSEKLIALIDVVKFKRVVYNIINNAVKYTGEGGQIRIIAKMESDRISVSVSDTGSGIPEEELEEIFKPFTRANKSSNPNDGSMGLGLYISSYFCRMMGGDISVNSIIGKGSVFTISLPQIDRSV